MIRVVRQMGVIRGCVKRVVGKMVLVALVIGLGCAERDPGIDWDELEARMNSMRPPPVPACLVELREAVTSRADSVTGESLEERKKAVAEATLPIFVRYGIDRLEQEASPFDNSFQAVTVREGTFEVAHGYFWRLTPLVEEGQIKDIQVKAGPICWW